jgi:hypothetical protein
MGLLPIDVAILKLLPAEGTMLAEYIPLGTTSSAIKKRLDNVLTAPQVSGRLMALSQMEYVVSVPTMPASKGNGWQRTEKAEKLLGRVEQSGDVFQTIRETNDAHFAKLFENGAAREPEIAPESLNWGRAEVHEPREEA